MENDERLTGKATRTWWLWALVAILLLAFALRIYRLGAESLWYDETVSVHLASKSLPDLITHTAGDIHPPGYYLLLHFWTRLAGSSDFAVAFPSLFFGMLLVVLAYKLGSQVYGLRAGVLAAFLVVISPFNLWYSQEVRMYTLGAALGMSLLIVLVPMLCAPPAKMPCWSRLLIYALLGALGLWVLYYFAFLLIAINLLVAVWWFARWRRKRIGWAWLGRWVLAQLVVLLLYAPWVPAAWRQVTSPPVPPWRSFTGFGDVLLQTGSALSLGQSANPAPLWPVLLLFGVLFAFGLYCKRLYDDCAEDGSSDPQPTFLAGYVLIPVFLIFVASLATPLFHVRYVFTYSTPFYVIIGAGLGWLWQRWRLAMWLSLAVIVAASGFSIYAYHTDPQYASDDHRGATRYLAEHWRPGDAILVNAGYAYTALVTYWDGDPIEWQGRLVGDWPPDSVTRGPVVFQTGTVDGDPSLGWGDPDSDFYTMSQEQTEQALGRLFADYDRVFVYRIYDTVTDLDGLIRGWLDDHGTRFEEAAFSGESQLKVQGYLARSDHSSEMTTLRDEQLADGSLKLLAHSSMPATVEIGSALDLALLWQAEASSNEGSPAKGPLLFAGLFDDQGRRWAQTDERPLGSLLPISSWPAGSTVRTPLRLWIPPDMPPGRYQLEIGWYRFVDGQPVWLPWTSGERLPLGAVEVVAPQDWSALPIPEVAYSAGVTIGAGVRLLGFDAPVLEGLPGADLPFELLWQAQVDAPAPGLAVLQLADADNIGAGTVVAEFESAPIDGRVPFASLQSGQLLRDPSSLALPGDLDPGLYDLTLGRRQGGNWLPVRRGPVPLGDTYPLATVRVLDRFANTKPPTIQYPVDAQFGDGIRFAGHDLQPTAQQLDLSLHWFALAPMTESYKIFVHLVGDGGPSDIRAQADLYPHPPTTAWQPGEYLADQVTLDLPADLPPGQYTLLLGFYQEFTGQRLPVVVDGQSVGDSLPLQSIPIGE